MNWRRGLFRLWIVGAALFVIAVGAISYSDIKAQFVAVVPSPPPQGYEILVPQFHHLAAQAGKRRETRQTDDAETPILKAIDQKRHKGGAAEFCCYAQRCLW
jgi:hypothetical protein